MEKEIGPDSGTGCKNTDGGRKAVGLFGGSNNALDDKGRLSFPAKLRNALPGPAVVMAKGLDECLWVFPPDGWEVFAAKIAALPLANPKARRLKEHFLGSQAEAEVDKSGRLPIPQELREYAGLVRDCKVMGLGNVIEVWDASRYQAGKDIGSIAEEFADVF